MTWNSKSELVKHSVKIAKKKYPKGFNKKELIESSKKVFGGFGVNPNKSINTMEDVNNKSNYFSEIDGHYPRGMSGCYVVGISGGCGNTCPVFLEGECDTVDIEMAKCIVESKNEFSEDEFQTIVDSYEEVEKIINI